MYQRPQGGTLLGERYGVSRIRGSKPGHPKGPLIEPFWPLHSGYLGYIGAYLGGLGRFGGLGCFRPRVFSGSVARIKEYASRCVVEVVGNVSARAWSAWAVRAVSIWEFPKIGDPNLVP